jgi:hypothetical protein
MITASPSSGSPQHLVAAGRQVLDFEDRLRRYCGLPWSGGPPEVWAFEYFDRVLTGEDPNTIDRVDVLAAGALHVGLSRDDLTFFARHAIDIEEWLRAAPVEVPLHEATDAHLAHLRLLPELGGPQFSLLTKVLHRKRPALVPMIDRPLIDRYRPITGERSASTAWGPLLDALIADLSNELNALLLSIFGVTVTAETGVALSRLRAFDIAVWMEGR